MENKRIFQSPGILDGVSTRKDKGMTIRFVTQELSEAEKVVLMSFFNKFGYILFSEDSIQKDQVPEHDTDIEGRKRKTPSQRLRNTIYVHGEQEGLSGNSEHDAYYEKRMEWHINEEKSYLE